MLDHRGRKIKTDSPKFFTFLFVLKEHFFIEPNPKEPLILDN